MDRNQLISEVKTEYARLADIESRETFQDLTTVVSPEAYYEKLLGEVISEINAGKFDSCRSGKEIVETVANYKM